MGFRGTMLISLVIILLTDLSPQEGAKIPFGICKEALKMDTLRCYYSMRNRPIAEERLPEPAVRAPGKGSGFASVYESDSSVINAEL